MAKYRLHEYIFFFAGLIFIIFLLGVSFYASQTQRDINSKAAYDTPTPAPTSNPQPSPTPTTSPYVNLACYGCVDNWECDSFVVTTAAGNTCESVGFYSSRYTCWTNCGSSSCRPNGWACGRPGQAACCYGSCYNWTCQNAVPPTPRKCSTVGIPCTSDGDCCVGHQCLPTYIGKVCN